MRPFQVKFHLYAEDEKEVQDLQCSLYDLVSSLYGEGIYVSASKLTNVIKQFGNSLILKQFLK